MWRVAFGENIVKIKFIKNKTELYCKIKLIKTLKLLKKKLFENYKNSISQKYLKIVAASFQRPFEPGFNINLFELKVSFIVNSTDTI